MSKIFILNLLFSLGFSLSAQALPVLDDEVKNPDGSVINMTWQGAQDYCSKEGKHLPTAREFAEVIRASDSVEGKYFILETQFPNVTHDDPIVIREADRNKKNSYRQVLRTNSSGVSVVDFYYHETYSGNDVFWTASVAESPFGPEPYDVHFNTIYSSFRQASLDPSVVNRVRCANP